MKNKSAKILIAGVGGQGIVYLTNIIAEAAVLSGIPVSVSEIHGLSQRGGTVTAGIGLGSYCTGFIGEASVDFLIGLELLETQRCIPYLHSESCVIFGNVQITPYSVNAQMSTYPKTETFIEYLENEISELIYISEFPVDIEAVLYNIFMLGRATNNKEFPLSKSCIEMAIRNNVADHHIMNTLEAFDKGCNIIINKTIM